MAKTLHQSAISLLSQAQIDGNLVRFPQVDYSDYQKIKPVMEVLGAPWSRKQQAHIFSEDVDPDALIAQIMAAGKLPDANPLAFFPTSSEVAGQMILKIRTLLPIFPWCRILEPSAGEGGIANVVSNLIQTAPNLAFPSHQLQLLELDDIRYFKLLRLGYAVEQCDFLQTAPQQERFDAILINPPFALQGYPKAYIDHIEHAFGQWLRPGGALVAIAPLGFTTNKDCRTRTLRQQVRQYGDWKELPDHAFRAAGTAVRTVMLWMVRPD